MYYTPLELSKLCSNIIVQEIYNKNEIIFRNNLKKLHVFSDIEKIIVDRYLVIKQIEKNK